MDTPFPISRDLPRPPAKTTGTFGLRPAYFTAIRVLSRRAGHDIASETVRTLVDREMRAAYGRAWESEIATIAAEEGVA